MLSRLIMGLLDHGTRLFPTDGRKVPLIRGWQGLASCNSRVVEGWRRQWAHCGFGWALPPAVVVTDLDMHVGENGIADFQRLDGRDPRDIATPTSTSPTGGLHLFWATAGRCFKNIRIPGASVDVKCKGGFVAVPDIIDGPAMAANGCGRRGARRCCRRRHGWTMRRSGSRRSRQRTAA